MKKITFTILLILPLIFLTDRVEALTPTDYVDGTYTCFNGGTIISSGSFSSSTCDLFASDGGCQILYKCPTGWTNVNLDINWNYPLMPPMGAYTHYTVAWNIGAGVANNSAMVVQGGGRCLTNGSTPTTNICDGFTSGDSKYRIAIWGNGVNNYQSLENFHFASEIEKNLYSTWLNTVSSVETNNQSIIDNQNSNASAISGSVVASSKDIINSQNNNTSAIIGAGVANTEGIINNQNSNQQQTNQKLDGINDSLTNSKVESGTGSSFFNDFKTNDNGGISSIITAPLVAINSMLDNTCSPMSVTYKGKEVSLPCGTEFWTKASVIQDYLNWFEGGILVYLIIRKLYKLIENMKNPDDDRVEVMDL